MPVTSSSTATPASILIVDDMPDKHLAFHSVLADLGEPIVSARSGREALAQVLDHEFAVILLDVNMPDIDGLETASLIRRHKRSARTPRVARCISTKSPKAGRLASRSAAAISAGLTSRRARWPG